MSQQVADPVDALVCCARMGMNHWFLLGWSGDRFFSTIPPREVFCNFWLVHCQVHLALFEPCLTNWLHFQKLNWVICGGYSGTQQRPMFLSWARRLRDECRQYTIAFFMKQLGSVYAREHGLHHPKGEV